MTTRFSLTKPTTIRTTTTTSPIEIQLMSSWSFSLSSSQPTNQPFLITCLSYCVVFHTTNIVIIPFHKTRTVSIQGSYTTKCTYRSSLGSFSCSIHHRALVFFSKRTNVHAYIEDCSFPYTFKRFYRGSIQLNEPAIRIALQTHAHATTDSSGGFIIAAGTKGQSHTTGLETPMLWFWE